MIAGASVPRTGAPGASLRVARLHAAAGPNSIAPRGMAAGRNPRISSTYDREEVTMAATQHPDHGRVLRLAAGLQDAVRRAQDPSRVPAGRGRPDQRRGLPRAPAGQGPQGPGACCDSRKLPGKVTAGGAAGVNPEGLRPDRARHAGAAVPLARRARTARRGGEIARALHVDHEHAAAALREAHPRPRLRGAQARLYRPDRVGQFRSRAR